MNDDGTWFWLDRRSSALLLPTASMMTSMLPSVRLLSFVGSKQILFQPVQRSRSVIGWFLQRKFLYIERFEASAEPSPTAPAPITKAFASARGRYERRFAVKTTCHAVASGSANAALVVLRSSGMGLNWWKALLCNQQMRLAVGASI